MTEEEHKKWLHKMMNEVTRYPDGRPMQYKLNEFNKPIPCSLMEWVLFLENNNTVLARTELPFDIRVSTIFLGHDHGFRGAPILFETMVFGGTFDLYCERYRTYEGALIGHKRVVEMVKKSFENN